MLRLHVASVDARPSGSYVGAHAHRLKHLGVASAGLRQSHALCAVCSRCRDRRAGRNLGQEGDENEQHAHSRVAAMPIQIWKTKQMAR